ncbi:MAG: TIGR00296 family protein [Candidatus Bathyarchaeota archaeon]|nr:TIGR00296 family protein [Candidatus Bathyarchaeota archaeon]MCZ2845593.1 TIGR00296 family protein [Candidatus Bathyarchaeota archaeon]
MPRSKFTIRDGTLLVNLARKTIEKFLEERTRIKPPNNISELLKEKFGVFVTLNKNGGSKELRGCIGYPYPTDPLIEAIINSAIEAATRDPRFPPTKLDELSKIVIEISILTKPELIEVKDPTEYSKKILIGSDGLIVEKNLNKGLLLPQVPVEWNWDVEEFLSNCCMKAGLPPDSWVLEGTRVYKFQAIIFEEEDPGGKVRLRILR